MLDESVKELEDRCETKISEPEDRDRAGRSLQKLSELLDKGIEICSSIGAPEDIKEAFPFKENSLKISKELKELLENKLNDNGKEKKEL